MLSVAATLLAAGCQGSGGTQTGSLLEGSGLASGGAFTMNGARTGNIDGFAFPLFGNKSKKPLKVTGFSFKSVPAGMKVDQYIVLDLNDTKGYLTAYRYKPADPGAIDVSDIPNYAGKPISIAPGQVSNFYVMAKVELTGKLPLGNISGCMVDYTQGNTHYQQTLPCAFAVSSAPSS